jgi:glutamine cyclotransferase
VFGEGITVLGNQLFQLTWRNHKVFVWDLEGNLLREMRTKTLARFAG